MSPTQLSVPVQVAPTAALGPRDVTVTESTGTATCTSCLNIGPAPSPTSVAPAAAAGHTVPVMITGTNLQAGLILSSSIPAATFGTPTTSLDATTVTVPLTVPAKAAAGAYDLTVTNPDGGVGVCTGCLFVSTLPGAPVVGTATPGVAQATVSFSPPAFDGGASITSYTVTAVDATNPANGGQTNAGPFSPITVGGLTNGDHYRFKVTATNAVGTGLPSALTLAVVPATVPNAPVIGAATPFNARAMVSFSRPAFNGGSPIISYKVTAIDVTNPANGGQTSTGTGSPIPVTGLTNGDSYRFKVTATNAVGTGPASALTLAVVPATVPGAPVIGTATPGNGQATVTFNPPAFNGGSPIISYTVTAIDVTNAANGGQTSTGAGSPITVTGLTNGDRYQFKVKATNAMGTGPASAWTARVVPS